MPDLATRLRRVAMTAAVMSLPALVVLAGLVAFDFIGVVPALAALVIIAVGGALVAAPYLSELWRLARFAGREAPGDAPAPITRYPETTDIAVALARQARSWTGHAEQAAAQARAAAEVLNSLPDPIVLISRERRMTRTNRAARDLLGQDLEGQDLSMALRHPSLLDAADALLEGGGGANVEFTLPGTVAREFIGRLLPLAGPVGGDAAAMLALYDLTLAKRTEQMRADFIANVSHELRTPLASLTGFVETLQGAARDDAEARERFLAIMHEQAARMGRLVEDLLSLSRIELSESLPLEQRVDLNRLLADLAAAMEPQAKARDMAVTLAEEVAPVEVTGDADQLSQVFQNLLDNALKYGREGTSVDIRVTRRNGEADRPTPAGTVAVAVTDHGQGIARKHLPRLTERFYRVDAARSRALGGTGLGLAIVKHSLNRHRGELVIDSAEGEGSTFTVVLPLAPPAVS